MRFYQVIAFEVDRHSETVKPLTQVLAGSLEIAARKVARKYLPAAQLREEEFVPVASPGPEGIVSSGYFFLEDATVAVGDTEKDAAWAFYVAQRDNAG